MIKINLLGKKKTPTPFALDEKLAKLGIKPEEIENLKPSLIKLGVAVGGIYVASFVNTYFYDQRLQEASQKLQVLEERRNALQAELAAKKDLRKQMDQLNKEEVELQRQVSAISGINQDRNVAFKTLDSLTASLPPKVWLSTVSVQKDKVSLAGSSWEYFPINDFIKAVNESTYYNTVNFKWIKAEEPRALLPGVPEAAQKIKSFEMDLVIKTLGTGQ